MSAPTHLAATPTVYEPCEECGAALDPQQRYCVNCAARRGNGANPSSRYFASMSKRARRPIPPASKGPPPSSRAAAVGFFALLPIAVAIGVLVGRADSSGGDEGALLQALRAQGQGSVASTASGGTAGAGASGKATKSRKGKGAPEKTGKPKEKVEARTKNGTVHQITGYKPTKKKIKESTKLVEENADQTGSGYIEAQQNLPDVIPVGGNPNEAPPLPTGKGE